MALESLKENIEKKNILLVCMTGKSSSRFLAFRFRNEFEVYINRLDVCSMYEFEQYDLHDTDYVFTTVPLHTAAKIPIYEISNFLDESDILQVRRKLEQGSVDFLRRYYRQELFFPHIQAGPGGSAAPDLSPDGAGLPRAGGRVLRFGTGPGADGRHRFWQQRGHPTPGGVLRKRECGLCGHPGQTHPLVRQYGTAGDLSGHLRFRFSQAQKFYQLTSSLISDRVRVKRIIAKQEYEHS